MRSIVCLDGILQEVIALLWAIAAEALLMAQLIDSGMHRVDGSLRQRQGDIADAHADNRCIRMRCGIVRNLLRDGRKQIALCNIRKIMIHFHRLYLSFS